MKDKADDNVPAKKMIKTYKSGGRGKTEKKVSLNSSVTPSISDLTPESHHPYLQSGDAVDPLLFRFLYSFTYCRLGSSVRYDVSGATAAALGFRHASLSSWSWISWAC